MKHILLIATIVSSTTLMGQPYKHDQELVRLSESYELANIILALTPYGKSDRWEVAQHSTYYQEVRKHFDAFSDHPLLQKVNYSREMWASYLSFRTDAYAFEFDGRGHLKRSFSFFANAGFQPFDENLELVNDFLLKTDFRGFYREHLNYYQELASNYLKSQSYDDMYDFLSREFRTERTPRNYAIALSPLVGRMNCHRVVNGVNTDFITVPQFLLSGTKQNVTEAEIVSGLHMLFTELDHGFVNPITEKYRSLVIKNFSASRWNHKSGYEKDSLAVFNEYMTWAVYDLFVYNRFPAVAKAVSADWALQNETRGFIASSLFNRTLMDVYGGRKQGQTISDLYPEFLKRLGKIEKHVQVPSVPWCNVHNQTVETPVVDVQIQFSEPMEKLRNLDVAVSTGHGNERRVKRIEISSEKIRWLNHGSELHLRLELEKGQTNFIRFNSPWTTQTVLKSKRGVDLPPYTTIKITVKE